MVNCLVITNTIQGRIGISPGGAITVISQLYTGSISDREIVVRSGFLDLPFEDNDSDLVMCSNISALVNIGILVREVLHPLSGYLI